MSLPLAVAAAVLASLADVSSQNDVEQPPALTLPDADIDMIGHADVVYYHRAGDSRSIGGGGFGAGAALRAHFDRAGLAITYTGVPTEATFVGLGRGPGVHFIDLDASYVIADTTSSHAKRRGVHVSATLEAGPSIALVERTFAERDLDTTPQVDVPGHATFGANAGFLVRLHVPWFAFGAGIGYRGGAPLGVRDAHFEGAAFWWVGIGGEISIRDER